jgi:anti-anti-sigma regulatory factor
MSSDGAGPLSTIIPVGEYVALKADQRRLEWMVKNDAYVTEFVDGWLVCNVTGFLDETEAPNWREAIDKAMEDSSA